jgi:hypothetical protein
MPTIDSLLNKDAGGSALLKCVIDTTPGNAIQTTTSVAQRMNEIYSGFTPLINHLTVVTHILKAVQASADEQSRVCVCVVMTV